MFFWLKKVISYFLMPLQLSLLLLLLGVVWLAFRRRARVGWTLLLSGLFVLLVASEKQVGLGLLSPLEAQNPPMPDLTPPHPIPAALAACHYIVVLGGGHTDNPFLTPLQSLSPSAFGRATEAARLALALPETKLIVSGPANGAHESHAERLVKAIGEFGIARARFTKIENARDTEDEAHATRAIVGEAPVALVTSAWHMPRAMALFRAAGVNVVPCPTDFQARPNLDFRWNDWTFDISGLDRTTLAVHEYLGLWWLRLRRKI
jgi:uncharacterized SAM-binding protein YcdF (DUF218 family)